MAKTLGDWAKAMRAGPPGGLRLTEVDGHRLHFEGITCNRPNCTPRQFEGWLVQAQWTIEVGSPVVVVNGLAECPNRHLVLVLARVPVGQWMDVTQLDSKARDGVNFGLEGDTRSPQSPEGHPDMAYDPSKYEERQAANEKSRQFAHRDGLPWSAEDDALLLQDWIFRGPEHRHESQVAKDLARTIEACRNRAHYLRGVHTGIRYNKQEERPAIVCTGCWLELPATGTCPNCE